MIGSQAIGASESAVAVLDAVALLMGDPASSSSDAAVPPIAVAELICGESTSAKHSGYYEFHWFDGFHTKPTKNKAGTSGWCRILYSTNPGVLTSTVHRIHICTFNPCQADWHAAKYGLVGPPIHLQLVEKKCESAAVADASSSDLPLPASVPTAVAEPPPAASDLAAELVPVEPAPVVEEIPVEHPASTGAPVDEPTMDVDMADATDCPKEASLQNMKAPAPTAPINMMHVHSQDVSTATAGPSTAVAAEHKIKATLLALAREIRRPRAYVGYSAFILMGMLNECQPCVCLGGNDEADVFKRHQQRYME
jgi:hypothetical protein